MPRTRLKLTIEYAGTRYRGWQIQTNARTVQGELERAIRTGLAIPQAKLAGAGRTDAGVHALRQVAHIDLASAPPPDTVRRRVNDQLPADISVLAVDPVNPSFHARHSAVGRRYLYQIARRRTALAKPYVWWVKQPLELARMQEAASAFVGLHDFRSFSDDDPSERSTSVQIASLEIGETGDLILIQVTGSHFIWKMVRRMVGVLVEVGKGELPSRAVTDFLHRHSDRPAQLTAPASGLFLARVLYPNDPWDEPLRAAVPIESATGTADVS